MSPLSASRALCASQNSNKVRHMTQLNVKLKIFGLFRNLYRNSAVMHNIPNELHIRLEWKLSCYLMTHVDFRCSSESIVVVAFKTKLNAGWVIIMALNTFAIAI